MPATKHRNTEAVRVVLQRAGLSVETELTKDEVKRARSAGVEMDGAKLRKHIMQGSNGASGSSAIKAQSEPAGGKAKAKSKSKAKQASGTGKSGSHAATDKDRELAKAANELAAKAGDALGSPVTAPQAAQARKLLAKSKLEPSRGVLAFAKGGSRERLSATEKDELWALSKKADNKRLWPRKIAAIHCVLK